MLVADYYNPCFWNILWKLNNPIKGNQFSPRIVGLMGFHLSMFSFFGRPFTIRRANPVAVLRRGIIAKSCHVSIKPAFMDERVNPGFKLMTHGQLRSNAKISTTF